MVKHNIDLSRFLPKGHVECQYKDSMLFMKTNRSIPTQRFDSELLSINSYIYLPDKFKLPLRIDLTAKIDAPGLYLLLGKGHVNFGTMWSDNRRMDDIASPARKIIFYHNQMPINEFTDISLIYDLNEFQIIIGGEERYYSKKERYMKFQAFRELNEDGFELKIACDKLVNLCIKSLAITEYEDSCGICRSAMELPTANTKNEAISPGEKPTFEKCISRLPECFRNEIEKIDEYLRTQKTLKFKRLLEKNGNKITYVSSDYGFSYTIYLNNDVFDHSLQWYIITNGKPETWHRKFNMMEETLTGLAQGSPEFAERMFYSLDDCVGCYQYCLGRTPYNFGGKQKTVCHGKLKFTMGVSGFEDVRTFIEAIKRVVVQETAS